MRCPAHVGGINFVQHQLVVDHDELRFTKLPIPSTRLTCNTLDAFIPTLEHISQCDRVLLSLDSIAGWSVQNIFGVTNLATPEPIPTFTVRRCSDFGMDTELKYNVCKTVISAGSQRFFLQCQRGRTSKSWYIQTIHMFANAGTWAVFADVFVPLHFPHTLLRVILAACSLPTLFCLAPCLLSFAAPPPAALESFLIWKVEKLLLFAVLVALAHFYRPRMDGCLCSRIFEDLHV